MRLWKKAALYVFAVVLSGAFTHKAYAVTPEEKKQIKEAVPKNTTRQPKKSRKMLVFYLCKKLYQIIIVIALKTGKRIY